MFSNDPQPESHWYHIWLLHVLEAIAPFIDVYAFLTLHKVLPLLTHRKDFDDTLTDVLGFAADQFVVIHTWPCLAGKFTKVHMVQKDSKLCNSMVLPGCLKPLDLNDDSIGM